MAFPSFFPFRRPLLALAVMLALGAGLWACKREAGQQAVLAPTAALVQRQATALRDSADQKWSDMIASDNQKIAIVRLLLQELRQQTKTDTAALNTLDRANAHLATSRYAQTTLTSDQINQYDAAQEALLKSLYPVAAPNGNAPTENARNFVEGIQQIDNGVVGFRIHYDQAAQEYNTYLRAHQAELQAAGGRFAAARPLPLFTIGAE